NDTSAILAPGATSVPSGRSGSTVDLQPPGRVRGHERRRTAGPGPDVSDAGLAGAAKDQRGADLDAALGRNGRPRRGAELPRTDSLERGPDPTRGGAITQ